MCYKIVEMMHFVMESDIFNPVTCEFRKVKITSFSPWNVQVGHGFYNLLLVRSHSCNSLQYGVKITFRWLILVLDPSPLFLGKTVSTKPYVPSVDVRRVGHNFLGGEFNYHAPVWVLVLYIRLTASLVTDDVEYMQGRNWVIFRGGAGMFELGRMR